jgi:hypothetical protein
VKRSAHSRVALSVIQGTDGLGRRLGRVAQVSGASRIAL